jgi:hypothetical protein
MDDPSRVGRVLIGAARKDLARTEEIKLPKGTWSFFISEEEPEVTFLETVGVKDSSSSIEQLIASSVVLRPGDAREFFIPKGFSGEITLRLRGYYKPLRFDRFVDSGPGSTTSPPISAVPDQVGYLYENTLGVLEFQRNGKQQQRAPTP